MTKQNLDEILSIYKSDIEIFNKKFKDELKTNVTLIDLVTNYILKQKGKKIRPLLVLSASKLCGGINERSYRGATLVELLHTATLIHDDVVDGAEKRRGLPSINAIWKNKISVLMGDYLLAKGLMTSVNGKDFDFLGVVSDTVKRMSEGELLQISKTRKLDIDEETYFKIISDKTASLLSTCCEIGALSATNDLAKIEAMKKYGEKLGLAFQIRDDILDFIGTSRVFGKPLGGDIKEKKITLPLIFALRNSSKESKSEIMGYIKKGSKNTNIKEVIEFVKSSGGIEYAEEISRRIVDEAKNELTIFDDNEEKISLISLLDFVIERKK